jgi:hypothetical protein
MWDLGFSRSVPRQNKKGDQLMSTTTRRVSAFCLITLLLLSFFGLASARKQGPVWQKGTVTKASWAEGKERFIEVDSEEYILLPDGRVRIARYYKTSDGQYYGRNIPLDQVYLGTEVWIRVEGRVIYQLIIEE